MSPLPPFRFLRLTLPSRSQCSHVALATYKILLRSDPSILQKWEDAGSPKIVLKVDSEGELLSRMASARERGLIAKVGSLCLHYLSNGGVADLSDRVSWMRAERRLPRGRGRSQHSDQESRRMLILFVRDLSCFNQWNVLIWEADGIELGDVGRRRCRSHGFQVAAERLMPRPHRVKQKPQDNRNPSRGTQ